MTRPTSEAGGAGSVGAGAVGADRAAARADRVTRAAIFALFPYPRRLRVATAPLRLAQRIGADRLLARSGLVGKVSPAAERRLRLRAPSRPLPPAGGSPSGCRRLAPGARWSGC